MPKPERHVFVCNQSRPPGHPKGSCTERGGVEVIQELAEQLTNRNLFGRIALTSTGCLGPCMDGPNMLVYPEGVMYCGVKKTDVAEIVEQHLLGGNPVERLQAPAEIWG
jgi:(2Fe-2S) ferredoxin